MSAVEVDVKEAVRLVLEYVKEIFQGEQLADLGLEEVEFDDASATWRVTVGFSRPWDAFTGAQAALASIAGVSRVRARTFKVLTVKDRKVIAMRDRNRAPA